MPKQVSLKGLQLEYMKTFATTFSEGLGKIGSMKIWAENWPKAKRQSMKSRGRTSTGLCLKGVSAEVFEMVDQRKSKWDGGYIFL